MRLINDNKSVNFQEEMQISLTLKELLVFYGGLATNDSEIISQWMNKFTQTQPIANETRKDDLAYKLYIDVQDILKQRNIHL